MNGERQRPAGNLTRQYRQQRKGNAMPSRKSLCCFVVVSACWLAVTHFLGAQNLQPPPSKQPPLAMLKEIKERSNRLGRAIGALQKQNLPALWLPDVDVYYQAATKIIELNEFFQPESAEWTL